MSSWQYQDLKEWIESSCPVGFKGIQPKRDVQALYCSDNQLTSLPVEIGLLVNLQALYCDRNQLTSLPAEIGHLTNLQKLYCSSNQLTFLQAEIGLLTNLQELDCGRNQLTSLSLLRLDTSRIYKHWIAMIINSLLFQLKLDDLQIYNICIVMVINSFLFQLKLDNCVISSTLIIQTIQLSMSLQISFVLRTDKRKHKEFTPMHSLFTTLKFREV